MKERLQGSVSASTQLLRSPASGAPCAHWRLRIVEAVAPGMELVHEVSSPEPLEMTWQADPALPPRTLRIDPEAADIEALPAWHRAGSPAALAVAQHFGLRTVVRVEEVLVRHGEAVEAEGILYDPATALSRGPFRTVDAPAELVQATVRLAGLSLRPALLPWALGTAAALIGAVGAVNTIARHFAPSQRLSTPVSPRVSAGIYVGGARVPHFRWP